MTDWEQHLQKQERRQKKVKKVFWIIIFCLLVGMLAQTVAGLMPEQETVCFGHEYTTDPNELSGCGDAIQITTRGTDADSIILIASDTGGLTIGTGACSMSSDFAISGTSGDAITMDADGITIKGVYYGDGNDSIDVNAVAVDKSIIYFPPGVYSSEEFDKIVQESEVCLTYGLAAVEWMAADKIMQESEDCNE